jgi:hypothetical protein
MKIENAELLRDLTTIHDSICEFKELAMAVVVSATPTRVVFSSPPPLSPKARLSSSSVIAPTATVTIDYPYTNPATTTPIKKHVSASLLEKVRNHDSFRRSSKIIFINKLQSPSRQSFYI